MRPTCWQWMAVYSALGLQYARAMNPQWGQYDPLYGEKSDADQATAGTSKAYPVRRSESEDFWEDFFETFDIVLTYILVSCVTTLITVTLGLRLLAPELWRDIQRDVMAFVNRGPPR